MAPVSCSRSCRRRSVLRARTWRWRHLARRPRQGLDEQRRGRSGKPWAAMGAAAWSQRRARVRRCGRAPSASRAMYLGTRSGVFRSTNGGRSWTAPGLLRPRRAAAERASLAGSVPGVTSLVVDPHAPATVYAGLNGHWVDSDDVWRGGVQDHRRREHLARARHPGQPVAISPARRPTVYAATGGPRGTSRLVRSTDGGRSWQPADLGLPSTYLWGLAFDPSTPATVYAAMGKRGIFESNDSGARWRAVGISVRTAR